MGRKAITFNEFKKRFDEISNEEYEYINGYSRMSNKIKIKHLKCGREYDVVASAFISTGVTCKNCTNKIISKKNIENIKQKKNHKEYIKKISNGEYELISEYIGYKEEATFKHIKCGNVYKTKYSFFMKGNRCPKCNKGTQYTKEELIKTFNITTLDILELKYPKVKIKCKKCNKVNEINISTLKQGYSHKCCKMYEKKQKQETRKKEYEKLLQHYKNKRDLKVMLKEGTKYYKLLLNFNKYHKDKIIIHEQVLNKQDRFKVSCVKCNHEWTTNFKNLHRGNGCPICNSSKGERLINQYLKNNKFNFEKEYRFMDSDISTLRFDFAIFINEKIMLIEFDGKQHFNENDQFGVKNKKEKFLKTKNNDNKKNEYCNKNNIPLLRIPYFEIKNIEKLLKDFLI